MAFLWRHECLRKVFTVTPTLHYRIPTREYSRIISCWLPGWDSNPTLYSRTPKASKWPFLSHKLVLVLLVDITICIWCHHCKQFSNKKWTIVDNLHFLTSFSSSSVFDLAWRCAWRCQTRSDCKRPIPHWLHFDSHSIFRFIQEGLIDSANLTGNPLIKWMRSRTDHLQRVLYTFTASWSH